MWNTTMVPFLLDFALEMNVGWAEPGIAQVESWPKQNTWSKGQVIAKLFESINIQI